MAIYLFKWQFHIFLVVVIIQVVPQIMHFQKINKTDLRIDLMVLDKM